MWRDSIAVLQKMGVEKASKDKECKDLKVELKKLDETVKDNQILSTESNKQKERAALLAIQKEAHQKIVAAAKDSNDTQPLPPPFRKRKASKLYWLSQPNKLRSSKACQSDITE